MVDQRLRSTVPSEEGRSLLDNLNVLVVERTGPTARNGPSVVLQRLLNPMNSVTLSQAVVAQPPDRSMPTFVARENGGLQGGIDFVKRHSPTADGRVSFFPNKELRDFLSSAAPDVVLGHPGDPYSLQLMLYLNRVHGIPLITHTMDDHLNTWPNALGFGAVTRRLTRLARPGFRFLLHRVYRSAFRNFAISQRMATEYQNRLDVEFEALRPPARTLTDEVASHQSILRAKEKNTIVFAGGIGRDLNYEALAMVATELDRAGLSLDIFSPDGDQFEGPWSPRTIVNHGYLKPSSLESRLLPYEYGLIALNNTPRNTRFVRLSWPSKLSEYLSLGITPIYIGPDTEASEMIRKHDLGYVAADAQDLSELIGSSRLVPKTAEALKFASEVLDPIAASRTLEDALRDAVAA